MAGEALGVCVSTRGGTEPPKIALCLVIYLLLSAAAFPSSSLCAPLRVIVGSLFKPLDFWLVHRFYMRCSTFKFIGLLRYAFVEQVKLMLARR